ncbi:MAG: trimethylamine methyltransferase family protein [Dehalobacterium sp.]
MAKFSFENIKQQLRLLSNEQIKQVHENALDLLDNVGIYFDSLEALEILDGSGCKVDKSTKIVKFPPELVVKAIESAPEKFNIYDREGNFYSEIGGDKVHFDPVSTPANVLTSDGESVRQSNSEDLKMLVKAVDFLPQLDLASTSVVCSDIPVEMGDTYIYYTVMKGTKKPIIGGAIDVPGVRRTYGMVKALFGSDQAVREKPYTIFDVCASAPLKYSHISSQNIIDCAHFGFPIETISVPMLGACSPVTLAGSIVQHTAESLGGLVLAQVVRPGNPYVYGGAPVLFDMKTTTTPMSALEANMVTAGYSLLGKYYGLPTHTYAALSDAKTPDYQAGYESGMSAIIAAMAGVNMISGAGGLDYVAEFSLEKLIMDAEVIGLTKRLLRGIEVSADTLCQDLFYKVGPGGDFLQTKHTRQWFKKELYLPGPVVDRKDRASWESAGKESIFKRAQAQLERVKLHPGSPLDPERSRALDESLIAIANEAGVKVPLMD